MSGEVAAIQAGVPASSSRGIKSVETAGKVLLALCASAGDCDLKTLALRAGMQPSLAHAYLTSFARLGLVRQDAATKRYALGEQALEVGMAALGMLDPIAQALQAASSLRQALGLAVAVSVWGDGGPTVIRVERTEYPLHLTLYEGALLSLRETATGRLFCAFLPPAVAQAALRAEAARSGGEAAAQLAAEFEAALPDIRARRLARVVGRPVPGVQTFGAPVFDYTAALVCTLVVVGVTGSFSDDWDGPVARALARHAQALSLRMGFHDGAGVDRAAIRTAAR